MFWLEPLHRELETPPSKPTPSSQRRGQPSRGKGTELYNDVVIALQSWGWEGSGLRPEDWAGPLTAGQVAGLGCAKPQSLMERG